MNGYDFGLCGVALTALPSGAVWWATERMLIVADLHLGRSERYARRGGALLPPYETRDTLGRLDADIQITCATTLLCLGDSFDDSAAAGALDEGDRLWLARLMAGRRWLWVEGNHDPGPLALGGTHMAQYRAGPLIFRHIAQPGAAGEVSGHYHPKITLAAGGQRLTRPCFLLDADRAILPAYGTYTGGMSCAGPMLRGLMGPSSRAVLLCRPPRPVPFVGTAGQRPTTAPR